MLSFPGPDDLVLPFEQTVLDGKPKSFQKWTVDNPHPGFGKDPNILNEYGHTKYPMFVGNIVVNNEEEEKAARSPSSVSEANPDANSWPK